MSIVEYEKQLWRNHQSTMTSFLSFLEKNKSNVTNVERYVLRLNQLNDLFNQAECIVDEIKYECIYPKVIENQKRLGKNSKKYKEELQQHLELNQKIKRLAVLSKFVK